MNNQKRLLFVFRQDTVFTIEVGFFDSLDEYKKPEAKVVKIEDCEGRIVWRKR